MNTESLWAGYCDGFVGDKPASAGFEEEEYEVGYETGILDRFPVVVDGDNSCFYEEYAIKEQ